MLPERGADSSSPNERTVLLNRFAQEADLENDLVIAAPRSGYTTNFKVTAFFILAFVWVGVMSVAYIYSSQTSVLPLSTNADNAQSSFKSIISDALPTPAPTHTVNPTNIPTHTIQPTPVTPVVEPTALPTHSVNPTNVPTHSVQPTTGDQLNIRGSAQTFNPSTAGPTYPRPPETADTIGGTFSPSTSGPSFPAPPDGTFSPSTAGPTYPRPPDEVEVSLTLSPFEEASATTTPVEETFEEMTLSLSPLEEAVTLSPFEEKFGEVTLSLSPVEESLSISPVEESLSVSPVEESLTSTPVEESLTLNPVEESLTSNPVEESLTFNPVEQTILEQVEDISTKAPYQQHTTWPTVYPTDEPTKQPFTFLPTESPTDEPTKKPFTSEVRNRHPLNCLLVFLSIILLQLCLHQLHRHI